jgi:putative endonuclease
MYEKRRENNFCGRINKHNYYVYILASHSGVLYIGVTNNLERRTLEHRKGQTCSFTKKYGCCRLIYHEYYNDINSAIAREKQLKRWNRTKKEMLIATVNPHWFDLFHS